MRHRDPRVIELCEHLRAAVDPLERIASEIAAPEPQPQPQPAEEIAPVRVVETDKLAFSVREASRLLGIGRGTVYATIKDRKIPSVKFGKRTLIPAKGLCDWLNSLPNR
jgi:excisionase family DNA binding protein